MRKILAIVMALAITALMFTSCGFNSKETTTEANNDNTLPTDLSTEAEPATDTNGPSSDYRSGQIIIDGIVYKLPLLVSEFEAQGWINDSFETGEEVEAGKVYMSEFEKGSSDINANIANPSNDSAVPFENCYIVEFRCNEYTEAKVEFPGNLIFGSFNREQLINAWGSPTTEDTGAVTTSTYLEYTVNSDSYYKFEVDTVSTNVIGAELNFNELSLPAAASTNQPATQANVTTPSATSSQQDSNPLSSVQIAVTNHVNVAALDALASTDPFEVKIVDKGYNSSVSNYGRVIIAGAPAGDDSYVVVLSNSSSSSIKDISIIGVAYDSNYAPVQFGLVNPGDTHIRQFTSSTEIPANGKNGVAFTNIDGGKIAGFAVLAYSYTDAAGQVHTNPLAETWLKTVYS